MRSFEKRKLENHPSSTFFGPKIQKKLKTGAVGDKYEVEADKVADKVVNNNSKGANGLFQSKKEEEVQQKPISESITAVQSKEMKEEEPVQKKEEAEKVQKKEMKEEEPVQKKEEEEKVQKKEMKEEEPVQKKEEEEKVQKKEMKEEEPVQKKEEEEKVQKKEEEEPVQAKCDDCEKVDKVQKKGKEEEEKPVQTKSNASQSETQNNNVEGKLSDSKGSGNAMDKNTKQEMESGFGSDFSNVRVHTDSNAIQMSQEMGAQAFTHGNDVYFNKGKYNPDSKEGKHLLAHELTHTIQQTGNIQKSVMPSSVEDRNLQAESPEFKGEYKLEQVLDEQDYLASGSRGLPVEKVQDGLTRLGFELPQYGIDGVFGNETKQAVLDFQDTYDLTYDGIVGEETIGVLDDIHSGIKAKKEKKEPSSKSCGETEKLPLSNSCYDYVGTCITETFMPDSKSTLTISIDVDYMDPPNSWIKEDVSIQVMKCGDIYDTKIGSKRVSDGNIPLKMETKIASVTPGDKYYVIIFSRSSSRLKTYYNISQ